MDKMAGYCMSWCVWMVVIAAISAHVDVSLDATGPFISRETASAFMMPFRSGPGVGKCGDGANRLTIGGASGSEYCKSQYARESYPETMGNVFSDNNDDNKVSAGWKYTYKKSGRPTRRKGLRPTGILWHKQTRSAQPRDPCDTSQRTRAELVFVVDLSQSQGQSLFYRQMSYIKSFINNFTIGPGHYQVAMVTYAFSPTIHFYLNNHSSVSDLHSAIDGVNFTGGASYLGSALKTVREDVLTTANGMRSGLSRYVLVLSDGLSSDVLDTQRQANQLKWTGATLFAVAFGDQIGHTELINVASDSGKVFPSSMQDHVFSILKNHLPKCPDCFRNTSDVGILFDSSTGLSPSQYYPAIDALITLLEALPIGPNNVHVSYTKFAHDVYPMFNFSQYQNKDDVVTQIVTKRSQYIGPSNLTRALDHMTNTGFTGSGGTRSAARKIVVVFTQGNFDDFNSVQASAEALKNSGVTLALVGIGTESSTNLTSLLGLASDPAFAFVIGGSVNISDDVLESLGSSVEFDICEFD